MKFKIKSEFSPTGDQPSAINQLAEGLDAQEKYQTLLGVTGSGKTFTVANVIERVQKPTLVLAHNKTLAAQLYSEFKQFFPENAVRSEEHTSELQSRPHLVCRLLLEKKKKNIKNIQYIINKN